MGASRISADEDQAQPTLGKLCESDCFVSFTLRALDIFAACQRWIIDALWVDLQCLSTLAKICSVHAVVDLIPHGSFHGVATELTFELEPALIIAHSLFSRLHHVVALFAEAHALKLVTCSCHTVLYFIKL